MQVKCDFCSRELYCGHDDGCPYWSPPPPKKRTAMRGKIVKDRYYLDNKEVSKTEFDTAFPDLPPGDTPWLGFVGWKPIESDALAVHPDQIKEAEESAVRHGVPTEFLTDGRPVLTSRSHRREYMKRYGFYDRDGGYGDAQRGDFKG